MAARDPESFLKAVTLRSWDLFKQDAVLLVLASLVVIVLTVFSLGLLGGPLAVGYYRLIRRRLRGEAAELGDVFSGFSSFASALLACIVVVGGAVIGFALLLVPGMLVILLTLFTLHAIAYQQAGVGAALSSSLDLVKANFLNSLLLLVALAVVNTVAGAVVFAVLITAPLSAVALTVAFEELSGLT